MNSVKDAKDIVLCNKPFLFHLPILSNLFKLFKRKSEGHKSYLENALTCTFTPMNRASKGIKTETTGSLQTQLYVQISKR